MGWGGRQPASKRQLQSFIGLLNHPAKVVRLGCPFLRSIINTMKIPQRQNQKVRLNLECRGDIVWWQEFLSAWNSVGFFPSGPLRATVYSNAQAVGAAGRLFGIAPTLLACPLDGGPDSSERGGSNSGQPGRLGEQMGRRHCPGLL